MRHIISILIENEAGALSRVVGLFSARGFNIESLTVAPTEDQTLSRLTLVTVGTDKIVEQIVKQLYKLIDVVKVIDFYQTDHVERELMLVKFKAKADQRAEFIELANVFRANILDVTKNTITIEVTGTSKKLDAFLEAVESVDRIIEVARTGVCGLARGRNALKI